MLKITLMDEANECAEVSGRERSVCAVHRMPFGAQLQADGTVRFRVWAPEAESMRLALEGRAETMAMWCDAGGWYEIVTAEARVGSRYRFVLPNGTYVPDPVSRFQPEDVSGPSEVMDPAAYVWRNLGWRGRPWEEAILYELHIGTFTPEGTFLAAIGKLDHLVELGVTAVEIMSVGDFSGRWNWGYDGVLLYAPDSTYGRPDDLKALVDAAHDRGIMVILDVVYNHFGPEGNYLPQYFPQIMTDKYPTPWGQALNFDDRQSDRTREFILHNALYWVEEFRMDGLRLDAVHAIIDTSSTHILDELALSVRAVARDRWVHLVLESDDTMLHRLGRDEEAQPLTSTAQWNHDIQLLAHLGMAKGQTEEQDRRDAERLGKALVEGFTAATQGIYTPSIDNGLIPPGGFVSFIQTHDVVGNRIAGERITELASPEVVRAMAAVYLLAPQVPMLFMGEEWGASTPFPYFCDFKGELAEAVRKGRLEQFGDAARLEEEAYQAGVPDPLAESTFLSAKLRWDEVRQGVHAEWMDWYRRALAVRWEEVIPMLKHLQTMAGTYVVRGPRALTVRWSFDEGWLRLDANLSDTACGAFEAVEERVIWQEGLGDSGQELGPWAVRWSVRD